MKKLLFTLLFLMPFLLMAQYTISDGGNTITVVGGGNSFSFDKTDLSVMKYPPDLVFLSEGKFYRFDIDLIDSPAGDLSTVYTTVSGWQAAYETFWADTLYFKTDSGYITSSDDTVRISQKLIVSGGTAITGDLDVTGIISGGSFYGEVYTVDNANATTIDAQNQWHAINNDISEGFTSGFTYQAGISGTMASAATGLSGDTVRFTDVAHGLTVGDIISTVGTTDYNGIFEVVLVNSTDIFSILDTWVSDQSGTWDRGTCLTCDAGSAGIYRGQWTASGISETINHVFDFAPCLNTTISTKAKSRRKFSNTDYGSFSGCALMDISVGDKIFFVVQNITGTGNLTIRTRDLNLVKISD